MFFSSVATVTAMDIFLFLLVHIVARVFCYSSGSVEESCDDLKPHHSGWSPETSLAPFTVTTDRDTYTSGEEVTVYLRAVGSTPFIGFILQAREVGKPFTVGSFGLKTEAAQLLSCHQRLNTAVSHTSNINKTFIQVSWKSEGLAHTDPVHFQASFVQNYKKFWINVTSSMLKPLKTVNISRAGCSVSKVCFSEPANCDPTVSTDCFFMSAMMLSDSNTTIHYEMTGPSNGYISFGFSHDEIMGNDDIYICIISSESQVLLQRAFSTGRITPQAFPLGNVSDVRTSVQDSIISCSFTSTNTIYIQGSPRINEAYHIMFAHGPSTNGKIQYHAHRFVSAQKIDISRPQEVRKSGQPQIIKAHGALMLTAWMTMGTLGFIVARFLKGMTKEKKLCGKDLWFLKAHSVLGCLVMILSALQAIMAVLRCGPKHPQRFLFNWAHAINGVVIKSLAVTAIFTGLKEIDSSLNNWLMKVMGGFVGWDLLFYIFFEIQSKLSFSIGNLGSDMMAVALPISTYFLGNCTFLVTLLVGIGMS
uniref:Ferric chelate reductase 1 n=1 Tax=Cynoglossus semilaevis TaxID=244447 RepID=A0A3P8VM16_CYNSE